MKFTTLFSLFLATLSVGVGASPIAIPNDVQEAPTDISNNTAEFAGDFEKRAPPKETERLQQIQKSLGKQRLQAGKEYAIQVTWTKNAPGSSTGFNTPAKAEMKKTQEKYGFDHTAIIVGKVQKDGQSHELDFKGNWYHLTSEPQGSGKTEWFKTSADTGNEWKKSNTDKIIKFSNLKEISGNWEEKVKDAAEAGELTMAYALEDLEANSLPQLPRLAQAMETNGRGERTTARLMLRRSRML